MQNELLDMDFLDPVKLCKRLARYFRTNLPRITIRVFRMKTDGIGIDVRIYYEDGDQDYMRVCDIWAQYNTEDTLVGYTVHNSLIERDKHIVYGFEDMLSKIRAMLMSHRTYIVFGQSHA